MCAINEEDTGSSYFYALCGPNTTVVTQKCVHCIANALFAMMNGSLYNSELSEVSKQLIGGARVFLLGAKR